MKRHLSASLAASFPSALASALALGGSLALALLLPTPLRAQDDVGLELRVGACAQPWARPTALLPVLRVEIRDADARPATILRVEVPDCDQPELVEVSGVRAERYFSRRVDMRATPASARTRVLGLLLADVYASVATEADVEDDAGAGTELPGAALAPSEVEGAEEPARPREVRRGLVTSGPAPARALRPPAAPPEAIRAPAATLEGSLSGAWASPGSVFGGADARVALPLGSSTEGLWAGAAIDVGGARGQDELGTIDLFRVGLAPHVAWWSDLSPVWLGVMVEARGSLLVAVSEASGAGVASPTRLAFTADVAVLGRLRARLGDVLLGIDLGLGLVVRGYEARAQDRLVAGWSGLFVPARAVLGAAF